MMPAGCDTFPNELSNVQKHDTSSNEIATSVDSSQPSKYPVLKTLDMTQGIVACIIGRKLDRQSLSE